MMSKIGSGGVFDQLHAGVDANCMKKMRKTQRMLDRLKDHNSLAASMSASIDSFFRGNAASSVVPALYSGSFNIVELAFCATGAAGGSDKTLSIAGPVIGIAGKRSNNEKRFITVHGSCCFSALAEHDDACRIRNAGMTYDAYRIFLYIKDISGHDDSPGYDIHFSGHVCVRSFAAARVSFLKPLFFPTTKNNFSSSFVCEQDAVCTCSLALSVILLSHTSSLNSGALS